MRTFASELIEVFADLQRKRIAHRNIKPANIVDIDSNFTEKKLRICNFEWAVELPPNIKRSEDVVEEPD